MKTRENPGPSGLLKASPEGEGVSPIPEGDSKETSEPDGSKRRSRNSRNTVRLAIRRLALLQALFVPPLVADGAVVRRNVPFTAHPRPDRHHDEDPADAYPKDPRHAADGR